MLPSTARLCLPLQRRASITLPRALPIHSMPHTSLIFIRPSALSAFFRYLSLSKRSQTNMPPNAARCLWRGHCPCHAEYYPLSAPFFTLFSPISNSAIAISKKSANKCGLPAFARAARTAHGAATAPAMQDFPYSAPPLQKNTPSAYPPRTSSTKKHLSPRQTCLALPAPTYPAATARLFP